jgi:hypothetical protein
MDRRSFVAKLLSFATFHLCKGAKCASHPGRYGLAVSADVERPIVQDVGHGQFGNKRGNYDG